MEQEPTQEEGERNRSPNWFISSLTCCRCFLLEALALAGLPKLRLPGPSAGAGQRAFGQVRELSLELRPAMLDDLGLLLALLWQFERYSARTYVQVSFRQTGLERRFPAEVETAAYRIVQEALTNVARHAGGSKAMVRFWANQEILHLRIQDQGVEFDVKATLAAPTTGGLSGMYERVVLLGGQLTIESAPSADTCLTAELPLGQPAGHGEGA
jgi:signal transduction histidine kinase